MAKRPVHCNWGKPDRTNHPINCVSWKAAAAYCEWQGKRIPTEQEWEFAAVGGGLELELPWGSTIPDALIERIVAAFPGRPGTHEVGAVVGGVFGLVDMAGNVWEWTASTGARDARKTEVNLFKKHMGGCIVTTLPSYLGEASDAELSISGGSDRVGFRCARATGIPAMTSSSVSTD